MRAATSISSLAIAAALGCGSNPKPSVAPAITTSASAAAMVAPPTSDAGIPAWVPKGKDDPASKDAAPAKSSLTHGDFLASFLAADDLPADMQAMREAEETASDASKLPPDVQDYAHADWSHPHGTQAIQRVSEMRALFTNDDAASRAFPVTADFFLSA